MPHRKPPVEPTTCLCAPGDLTPCPAVECWNKLRFTGNKNLYAPPVGRAKFAIIFTLSAFALMCAGAWVALK